jgi:hypothetical protein
MTNTSKDFPVFTHNDNKDAMWMNPGSGMPSVVWYHQFGTAQVNHIFFELKNPSRAEGRAA